ncbi:MAG: helix-turn-helix domain-containing protein [Bacteroidaceae bacterium]|nr:helix-turn-helix domain-containing protein [Bacteroidaceae bacterium]
MKGNYNINKLFITKEEATHLAEQIAKHLFSLMENQRNEKVLTKKQMAEYLGVSTDAIDKMCDRGQLPFHTKGKHRYFSQLEILDHFLK